MHDKGLSLISRQNIFFKIKMIFFRGAKVNIQDSNRGTPLHAACFYGNTDIAKNLIKAGSNINEQVSTFIKIQTV